MDMQTLNAISDLNSKVSLLSDRITYLEKKVCNTQSTPIDDTITDTDKIIDHLFSDMDEYGTNIRFLLEQLLNSDKSIQEEYCEWFEIN